MHLRPPCRFWRERPLHARRAVGRYGSKRHRLAAHALAAVADARDFTQAGLEADALRELGLFLGTRQAL